jgi:uncharacterized protein
VAGKFEVYKDKKGEFRFRLKAGNGQTILASEGYKTKASAMNGIKSVQSNCRAAGNFEKSTTPGGKFRFTMKAKNKQVIGTSQNYATEASRDNGVAAVARAVTGAKVDDLT